MRDSIAWLYGQGFPKSNVQLKPAHEPIVVARAPFRGSARRCVEEYGTGALSIEAGYHAAGRHPANVVLDEVTVEVLDEQTGVLRNGGQNATSRRGGRSVAMAGALGDGSEPTRFAGDSGGASRFFYVAKASTREREAGLGAPKGERANRHPTVKPVSLMRWLVRLVTPPGGLVLDPFAGSGSTGCAAIEEGFGFIGIERDSEHAELARKRIAHWESIRG
jgi:site-specific DNA-methyltransferase (adenine-specific)